MKSLRCVLAATVKGARDSRVLLTTGLMAPSRADVAGHRRATHFHPLTSGPAGPWPTNRVLRVLTRSGRISPVDEDLGRLAGKLRYRARADDGIDALVAAEAVRTLQPCVLLTSDPGDLTTLLTDHPQVTVRPV